MITLPEDLTAVSYPGYFWDVRKKKLYSIKIGGVLKELKEQKFGRLKRFCKSAWMMDCNLFYYSISVKGKQTYLTDNYLNSLTLKNSKIPYVS